MHPVWSLCCLVGVDYVTLYLLQLSLPLYLTLNLLLTWVMGLARLVVLMLGVRAVSSVSKLPPWLKGEPLLVSSAALSLLVPSCATFTAVLSPRTSAELLHRCGHADLFIYSYLITVTSTIVWHQLFLDGEDEEDKAESPPSVWRLIALLRPYGWRFLLVSVFLVLSSWSEMVLPSYTGQMTDWIQEKKDPSIFWNSIIAISLITLCSAVTEFLCDGIYNITMSLVHTQTQGKLLHAILKQDITFFDTVSTGDITSRITTDITAMSEALSHNLSLLMWYLMRLIFLTLYMFSLSSKLTLFTVLCLLVITIVPKLSGAFSQNLAVKVQKSLSEANQVALEIFSNMKTVRSFANEEGECRRYEAKLQDTYALNKMEAIAYGGTSVANSLSGLVLKVGILYFGGRLVTYGEVSGGELVAFVLYELQFTSAVEVLQRMYPDVQKAVGSSEKVFQYMDRIPQLPPPGSLKPTNLKGHIQFKNVTFSYPKRPDTQALQDVSFDLREGQVTALVGACDAGKSTVVKLLLKFYQPQKGQILLDGRPLSEYDNEYYRKKVSVVSQEPVLTARSLKDNISYGLGEVPLPSVKAAAVAAYADDFISDLASGYSTGAGQRGGLLSGGQKQRIALARALLRDPKILILDDVSSSLDTESELKIQSTVYDNPKKRTVLLISHRMNIVEKADHILVLEGGQIKESGRHEQLLAQQGSYRRLWDKQHSVFHRDSGEQT
ncbi:antigen peptide transporter 1 [Bufo bufo]|uniref:antigen peptide transporter 1 n=1 Tax=Bufo bufo TaxID=8384 RepID=UPI001ABDD74A|nr:antigen peptide transporter 1 [Bufo bufo]XP_040261332.1 antigen peptide transporter 1 [Bufo bufo]XP_040261333.1 antigen peptide transporter 1 [Bufo bufo]XP_040261334.1 antigen peptide transporter 1 [Bufo bufo]